MRRVLGLAGVLLALGVTFFAAPAAHGEERTCRGTLGAVTVDNLRVPQGATCTLQGTRVQGTVKVERNATLRASAIRVIGNVQSENARRVALSGGSRIGGSVQVVQGGSGDVRNSVVTGSVQYISNRAALVAHNNTINGDLQAFGNSGGVRITNNRIDANLQCKENRPAPTGGGNVVQGNKEDQCARL